MPEEWPIAAPAADGNGLARAAGRGRLATVRRDFFLDPAKRLTEQERALMTAMLHCLVSDIADAIRAALPSGRIAANDEGDAALVAALTSSGLLDEPALMALLLRRADEERIATAARARSGRREARVLQGLVSHDYGAVAAAAIAHVPPRPPWHRPTRAPAQVPSPRRAHRRCGQAGRSCPGHLGWLAAAAQGGRPR